MIIPNDIAIADILSDIAKSIDISPTDYARAVRSYNAVAKWLEGGFSCGAYPGSDGDPAIYPQGSIRLGTIVRPLRDGKEADFDVDLVCELQSTTTVMNSARTKGVVGKRLEANGLYEGKLDKEGKRCWTLSYAESEGIGFHMDILPCLPSPAEDHPNFPGAISITNKDKSNNIYAWKPGNPKGYGDWFHTRNTTFGQLVETQKQRIFDSLQPGADGSLAFRSIDEIPDQLVRTPLQRAIQLLKRHRDIRFADNPKYKPISIIITTLAAHFYQGEQDLKQALSNIIALMALHADLVLDRFATLNEEISGRELITRDALGHWNIPNPVNGKENFADRWHEDENARAKAFFDWAQWLEDDFANLRDAAIQGDVSEQLDNMFGMQLSSVSKALRPVSKQNPSPANRIRKAVRSLFAVPWKKRPTWPMDVQSIFHLEAKLSEHNGYRPFTFKYPSDSFGLDKNLSIRFKAPPLAQDCDYYWQITNTGNEATKANQLRGGMKLGTMTQTENTLYSGKHCVQCFVIKNGRCIAQSHEFVVAIR